MMADGVGVERPARVLGSINPLAGGDEKTDLAARIPSCSAIAVSRSKSRLHPGVDVVARMREAVQSPCLVVAGGGDGTLNTVASVVVSSAAASACCRSGPRTTLRRIWASPGSGEAVGVIADGATARVDVGDVNGHVFSTTHRSGSIQASSGSRRAEADGHGKWTSFAIAAARADAAPAPTARTDGGRWTDLDVAHPIRDGR